jgi:hypothetical protein
MAYKKGPIRRHVEKISAGEFMVLRAIITVVISVLIGLALQQRKAGTEIYLKSATWPLSEYACEV